MKTTIVDRLAAEVPWVRQFCMDAVIIAVQFPVFPGPSGETSKPMYDVGWTSDRIPNRFIPWADADETIIRAYDARPPFKKTVIISEQDERGALFVEEQSLVRDTNDDPARSTRSTRSVSMRLIGVPSDDWPGGPRSYARFVADGLFFYLQPKDSTDPLDEAANLGEIIDERGTQTQAMVQVNPEFSPAKLARFAETGAQRKGLILTQQNCMMTVLTTFGLMNTSNVVRVPVESVLDRAARRRGDRPPYRYHVLRHRPFARRRVSEGTSTGEGALLPLHIAKGHRKTFTKERPLFGKYVGTWWWESQVRGRDTSRVVEKDYAIVAEAAS